MKRAAVSVAGFAFGLFLTWLSLYIGSHIDGHREARPGGCFDRDDCAWWVAPLLLGYVFLLPILFGVLNGVAWQHWSLRKWGQWLLGLSLLTIAVHLASYL